MSDAGNREGACFVSHLVGGTHAMAQAHVCAPVQLGIAFPRESVVPLRLRFIAERFAQQSEGVCSVEDVLLVAGVHVPAVPVHQEVRVAKVSL